jgi:lipoyl(octanoyl) transferase
MKRFRLIKTLPASASFNMALDEVLFSTLSSGGISTFRVYQWQRPSFSIGISQDPRNTLLLDKCFSDGVSVVRRMTGGGALFHNDEITYSFSCTKEEAGEPKDVLVSYRDICGFLLLFYKKLGLSASFACQDKDFSRKSLPHDLCSASHEKYDLLIRSKKIGGNAQKRCRNFIFQHGAVPLSIDHKLMQSYFTGTYQDAGSEVTTLKEEIPGFFSKSFLEDTLISSFCEYFDVRFVDEGLSIKEEELLKKLEEEKYGHSDWNINKIRKNQACLA